MTSRRPDLGRGRRRLRSERPPAPGPTAGETSDELSAERARRDLGVFFVALVVLSVPGYIVAITRDNPLILVVTPALASVVARLARHGGWADVSFRFGPARRTLRVMLVAYGAAVAYGLVPAFVGLSLHLVRVDVPPAADGGPNLLLLLLVNLTVNPALGCILVLGEEIGWRGYMLTRLIDANAPHPLLAHALVWGTWHLPLVLAGVYPAAGTSHLARVVPLFLVTTGSLAYVLAWARLKTGSIWPGAVGHSVANFVGQSVAIASIPGDAARLWVGEAGVLSAGVLAVIGAVLWTRFRPPVLYRAPGLELRHPAVSGRR